MLTDRFLLRLVARYLLLLAAAVLLNFFAPRLLPGDPLGVDTAGSVSGGAAPLTSEARAALRATYHLDDPPVTQFALYLSDLGRGNLGWSISHSAPVANLLTDRLPWTVGLVLTSSLIACWGGALLGLLAAWQGGRADRLLVVAASSIASVPEFLLALALLLVFASTLGWFPLSGGHSLFQTQQSEPVRSLASLKDLVWHLMLPSLTLVLANTAVFLLLARGAAYGVLAEPYITSARARGLTEHRAALAHALPNMLPPLATFSALRLGQVLGGAIVVERVFSLPGLGLFAVEAIRTRDFPVLQAVFLLGTIATLLASFTLEVFYRRLPEPAHLVEYALA